MSFGTQEVSADRGEPIHLYLFRYGQPAGAVIAYTDAEQDRDFEGVTYKAIAIDRDEITSSGTLDNSSLEVRTPDNTELADLFRLYPPSHIVTLTIRQGHVNDLDGQFLVNWSGRIIGFATEGNEARYTGEPISTSMRRNGLRRRFQYGCPHALYDAQCKADKVAATEDHIAMAVLGAVVTLAADWTPDARKLKFQGGLAEWTLPDGRTEIRTILRCDVDGTVVLAGYANGLDAGETISLSLGCNHKAGVAAQPDGDCGPLHNNVLNFGGCMWIPTASPVGLKNNFY